MLSNLKIYLGADHAGFHLKEQLRGYLIDLGYDVVDMGAHRYDEKDDYPDFVLPVARKVAEDPARSRGIVLGGSGEGEAMAANRFPAVRAAVWYGKNERILTLSREHNDANVLAIGARFVADEEAKKAVELWLQTPFPEEERHMRRLRKFSRGSILC